MMKTKKTILSNLHRMDFIWLAAAFTAGLLIFEHTALPFKPQTFNEIIPAAVTSAIEIFSVALSFLFFWAAMTSKPILRWVSLVLFTAAVMAEYGYAYTVGRFSIMQDYFIGIDTFDYRFITNAIGTFLAHWTVPVGVIVFGILLFFTRKNTSGGYHRWVVAMVAMILFNAAVFPFSRGIYETVSFSAGLRTLVNTGLEFSRLYHGPREAVGLPPQEPPKNNIIFVVDESLRGDHLSLNGYERSTTPYLETLQQQGLLYNWGIAVSGGTTSYNSNALLLSGTSDMPDTQQNFRKQPSIFQYAKAMGYKTYALDAQMDRQWLFSEQDLQYIDLWQPAHVFQQSTPGYDVDFSAARAIRSIITQSSGNFIWVNKSGVHFPYSARYPEQAAKWFPIQTDFSYDPAQKEQIRNVYDNAIAYNLDRFFKTLMGDELPENTVVVYTADHGQTLSENGEGWPHSGTTRMEATVPLFIVSKSPLQVDTSFKARHANIFPTLLDFMSVPHDSRRYGYAPSLLSAGAKMNAPRKYIFGMLESPSSSLVLDFDPEPAASSKP